MWWLGRISTLIGAKGKVTVFLGKLSILWDLARKPTKHDAPTNYGPINLSHEKGKCNLQQQGLQQQDPEWKLILKITKGDEQINFLMFYVVTLVTVVWKGKGKLSPKERIFYLFNSFRFGRKKTTVAFMIIAGLSIVAVSFIPAGTDNTGNKQPFMLV